jgi:hypothetical protein
VVPIETGIMIFAVPETGVGALALPVEDDKWLVVAAGYGDLRPSRDPAEFVPFLYGLRDPAIADLVQTLGAHVSQKREQTCSPGIPPACWMLRPSWRWRFILWCRTTRRHRRFLSRRRHARCTCRGSTVGCCSMRIEKQLVG